MQWRSSCYFRAVTLLPVEGPIGDAFLSSTWLLVCGHIDCYNECANGSFIRSACLLYILANTVSDRGKFKTSVARDCSTWSTNTESVLPSTAAIHFSLQKTYKLTNNIVWLWYFRSNCLAFCRFFSLSLYM